MILERNTVSDIISRHQKMPPVKVTSIANDLGLKIYNSELGPNVSGMIRRDKQFGGSNGYAIFVNSAHAKTRQRFTIAHEIGHYLLHKEQIGDGIVEDALLRADGLTNALERQANRMAADILMPWTLIDEAMKEKGITTIEGLASLFDVSRDAMSYRVLGVSYPEAQAAGHC